MSLGRFRVPSPQNEPVLSYAPGSPERAAIKDRLKSMASSEVEIPLIIDGQEIQSQDVAPFVVPHDHQHKLANVHKASPDQINAAISSAVSARAEWAAMPWEARAGIFLKAADLLAGPYRDTINAATMLGQSKTVHQSEIDAACELADFWRFNVHYAQKIYDEQPESSPGCWNYLEHRPIEGFVFAVSPFNFTSIGGNLPTAPAIMGATAVWKPATTAALSSYYIMKLLIEAGLPPGVINFICGSGPAVGNIALAHPDLGGVHFTGSTGVFQTMWKTIGTNIASYRSYPRIVGETGGKDFVFAHASADTDALAAALIRGAFEFQGQKCSAASRAFIPASIWPSLKERLVGLASEIKMGDPTDFTNFMGAVIDKPAYDNIKEYIDYAKSSSDATILHGGGCDDSRGYFIEPTIIEAKDPKFRLMAEEIFGPVLTLYVYPDDQLDTALTYCNEGSPYALTGGVFAQDRRAVVKIANALRDTAGNFYINDKPTGAVVGQQPFGGGRASGTNDKAGSVLNLMRWVSPRTIKETFVPPTHFSYPFMDEK